MDFLELAEKRYSVRKYKETEVSKEDIDKILLAAKLAPTACNNQPQHIVVVNTKEGFKVLKECNAVRYNAPLAFVVCYDKNKAYYRDYDNKCSGDVDASIITTHMMMEATELGLGSVWIMHFDPKSLRCALNLEENIEPVAILLVGYQDMEPSPRHRDSKSIQELTSYFK